MKHQRKEVLTKRKLMTEISKSWIEAAKMLCANTHAIVSCPECKIGILKVKDEPIKAWNKVDRYVYCDTCGKFNTLLISKSDD